MSVIIVSRHPAAVRWIHSRGYNGEIVEHFTGNANPGDIVIGILPIPLIQQILSAGAEFILLSLPSIAFSERGQELSIEEMEAAGAVLHRVVSIEMEQV